MNDNLTDITIVLDRSGSMSSIANDTIGGFNKFLADQQKAAGQARLTLCQFDHVYEIVHAGIPIWEVKPLTSDTFVPRGNTALLDAIGRTIAATGNRLRAYHETMRPAKVVFVIITDGEENSSKEFTEDQVNQMVKHQTDTYKWEFVFLGANMDAVKVARGYGFAAANVLHYAATGKGMTAGFAAASSNLAELRSGNVSCMAFGDDQKEEQKQEELKAQGKV